jgi:hypothetical protein
MREYLIYYYYKMEDSKGYQRAVEKNENDRLTYYSKRSNMDRGVHETEKLFVNMSLIQIIRGVSQTLIGIINEIVSGEIRSANQLLVTLFRADRMMYIGILLVMVAFAIYIVDITS